MRVVRHIVYICCCSLNALIAYWAWNGHISSMSPSVADLVTTRAGAVGADMGSVGLVYASPFALVKSHYQRCVS